MDINGKRLIDDLKALREMTDTPGEGVTRFSYGENDRKARAYIKKIADDFGFSYECDGVGNVIIAPKESRRFFYIGSHIDTVRNGGWLDGIYGVMSGMELLRTLQENGCRNDAALIIFAEEEGSNFGSTLTGSKFITGKYKPSDLDQLKNDAGRSLRELASKAGFDPSSAKTWNLDDVKMMIELHIEQGPVLDDEDLDLGIVDTIFGMKVAEVSYEGVGNHAGASPMSGRRDAMTAAAETVLEIEKTLKKDPIGRAVATVGRIYLEPDCSNVIPEKAVFTVEVRDSDNKRIDGFMAEIIDSVKKIADARNIKCTIRDVADSKAIPLSHRIVDEMDALAKKKELRYKVMESGAVHDAAMIAGFVETGMIFVPSKNGRSHVPEEDTDEKQLAGGTQFLMDFISSRALK